VPGLDKLGAGNVGERTLRATVARLRAVRAARSIRRTRGTPAAVTAATTRPPDGRHTEHGGGLAGGDHPVQAESVRPGLGMPGQQRLQDWPWV